MRHDLPSGTVTFLLTDVEGSTRLLRELGESGYAGALTEHRRLIREACAAHAGVEVDTQGDAFFFAFPTAPGAVEAAVRAREALAPGPIRVRMGIHTGTPLVAAEGYVGADVHKAARIAAAGHGGQVLLSKATCDLIAVETTDLGEHRLKDFEDPAWIFQLGSGHFPPLRTISNTNLPRPASSFVGREKEVEEVVALLRDGARLVTLTGPGGSGKTRLAIEAAAELVPEFKAGVFWVDLAPLRDWALVTATIAQTLGARDELAGHIGERELLLLLDNLEQVVDSAPELSSLIEACPNLRLLSTSRELLRVAGEVEYPVLPLAEPDAVDLFCTRARSKPDETVRELCRALDNLPLALELAAARTSVLSPKQIVERLSGRLDLFKGGRDADPRQQTLRATIEWSYELLTPDEQSLFARLAVFHGGCTLEAAEEIAGADLDTIQSLVDKSLVRRTEDRFWMLETIREYAAERLVESREPDPLRRHHAAHYLALAEAAEPHLSAHRREWLDRLDDEHDNLRAADDWLQASGENELALQLTGALSRYWLMRGHAAEGWRRLEAALRADHRPTAARAKALIGASMLAIGDATGRLEAEEALALHRALGDAWGTAHAQLALASSVAAEDIAGARQLYDESARAFRELGDEHQVLIVTRGLAWACISLGDRERGRALHEENLRRARALSNDRIEAITLGALAMLDVEEGRTGDGVVSMLTESHRLHVKVGDPVQSAFDVFRFAALLAARGRAATATRVFSSADALCAEIGISLHSWDPAFIDEMLATIHSQLDAAVYADAWGQGRALTGDQAIALALEELEV